MENRHDGAIRLVLFGMYCRIERKANLRKLKPKELAEHSNSSIRIKSPPRANPQIDVNYRKQTNNILESGLATIPSSFPAPDRVFVIPVTDTNL
jgi:hypothetical protein